MFHKIQDGDTFKLIPQISKENGILWIREMDCLFIEIIQYMIKVV